MKTKIGSLLWCVLVLPCVVSCNLYSPFQTDSSVQDHLEAAQKCLRDGDIACAQAEYQLLPDGELKHQKLCLIDLSAAGFTLSAMIRALSKNSSSMLGLVANALIPYSDAKLAAAADAAKAGNSCDLYGKDPGGGDFAALLQSIALISHCALLIAKVDQLQAASNDIADPCTTTGRNAGAVLPTDIADGGTDGTIVKKGMCPRDALTCRDDVLALATLKGQLAARFSSIKSAYDQIPPNIVHAGTDTIAAQVVRGGIQAALVKSR